MLWRGGAYLEGACIVMEEVLAVFRRVWHY